VYLKIELILVSSATLLIVLLLDDSTVWVE